MKYLVTYWSQTGNTKKVAEAVFEELPGEKTLKPIDDVENLEGFDLTFIGFPVMQFGLPPEVKKFAAAHAEGKKIAVFITHAMLTNSDDQQQQVMLAKELEMCMAAFSKSHVVDIFHCQGELSEKMANELIASNIPMLAAFAAMRPLTIGHPNQNELSIARKFAKSVIASLPARQT